MGSKPLQPSIHIEDRLFFLLFFFGQDSIIKVFDSVAIANVVTSEFNIIFLVNHCDYRQCDKRRPFLQVLKLSRGIYSVGLRFVKQIPEIFYELL